MPLITRLSHRTIPAELLHRIIVQVVADSIHAICVYPGDVTWEMNVLPTFCRVSYAFREITLLLIKRAFQAKPEGGDISSIFPPIAQQFERLRLFGNRLHRPPGTSPHFEPQQSDALLIFGYSLFIAAIDLRFTSFDSHPCIFQNTQEIILSALATSLCICPQVQPVGLADVLSDTMRKQMDVVRSGLDAVCAAEKIEQLMETRKALESPEPEPEEEDVDVELKKTENLSQIIEQVEQLLTAYSVYARIIELDDIFRASELPGIFPVIQKLNEFDFEGKHCFASDMEKLLQQWTATSTLPEGATL
ncbi:hypothetical protein H0H92_015210 [Tricholoma furcatifolium]|nr:hypothetical protein H0H92_015210 [Tricholoma furcatifolium]